MNLSVHRTGFPLRSIPAGDFTPLLAAIAETVIAVSLLLKKGLSFMLPIGLLYSFGLWTTAEGWGGPYGTGFTGNKGDVLGTAIIYCLIFRYLMVVYPPFRMRKTLRTEHPSLVSPKRR